jgi:hypothetical protein
VNSNPGISRLRALKGNTPLKLWVTTLPVIFLSIYSSSNSYKLRGGISYDYLILNVKYFIIEKSIIRL